MLHKGGSKSQVQALEEPQERPIVVYTDGASSGNPGPSGIGIVLRYGSHEKEISKYIGIATNNIAELTAIKTALQSIKRTNLPINLYTDSQYCYGMLALNWKPKRNLALISSIKKIMKKFPHLRIIKVEGHAGKHHNERADCLARQAIKSRSGSISEEIEP
nr:ribonuclease HI [Desulfobacterales bacterium]